VANDKQRHVRWLVLAVSFLSLAPIPGYAVIHPLRLWYDHPAKEWVEALPIGNGRLGGMIYGGVQEEVISLNEDTLYAGEPGPCGVAQIHEHVDKVFALIKAGKYEEADQYVCRNMLGRNHQTYTTLGNLRMKMRHAPVPSNDKLGYRRELDLNRAVARTRYRIDDATYTREYFASAEDNIIVIRIISDKPGRVSLSAILDTPHKFASLKSTGPAAIALCAKLPMHGTNRTIAQIRQLGDTDKYPRIFDEQGGLKHEAAEKDAIVYASSTQGPGMPLRAELVAVVQGGHVIPDSSGMHIHSADAVTLLLAADSSFNGFDKSPSREGVDAAIQCQRDLKATAAQAYQQLLKRHVTAYRSLFDRVHLDLGSAVTGDLPTDQRIKAFAQTHDPQLLALYFQYGRYLMISSSWPGTQPANLQGIWSDQVHAPWNGGYTTNINAQMNYWLAEVGNLAECHQPLLDLIDECALNGRITAKESYQARGWVCHHNVSIWRVTDPLDNQARFSFWPMAGAWLCRHVWERYEFSGDRAYLEKRAYPLMKGAAEFCLDWLREDEAGRLVTPIATSPENQFQTPDGQRASVSLGSTMDMAIIWDLLTNTLKAAELLQVDAGFRRTLGSTVKRLLPAQVGRLGQLQEWSRDWDDPNDHHRHLSHLYGAYPGEQITPQRTPDLAAAAAKSLKMRGPGTVGFGRAWSVNLWARLGYPERAYQSLAAMLEDGSSPNLFTQCYAGRPLPFDIDPSFGGPAGVAEMLLQSHDGEIQLLPALPKAWPQGSVQGLRARRGFEIDIQWQEGRLRNADIRSHAGKSCRIRSSMPLTVTTDGRPVELRTFPSGVIEFGTHKGKSYQLRVQ